MWQIVRKYFRMVANNFQLQENELSDEDSTQIKRQKLEDNANFD